MFIHISSHQGLDFVIWQSDEVILIPPCKKILLNILNVSVVINSFSKATFFLHNVEHRDSDVFF